MMTNEWGPPLTGEEMKALKGRIDIAALVMAVHPSFREYAPYHLTYFDGIRQYHLSLNHPYNMVREHNAKHPDKLMVLHNGSAKVPEDWDGKAIINVQGDYVASRSLMDAIKATDFVWRSFIAYTPKPKESEVNTQEAEFLNEVVATLKSGSNDLRKEARILKAHRRAVGFTDTTGESEVAEQFPSDEAIEYVLQKCEYEVIRAKHVKEDPIDYRGEILAARLIQQYEPDRLKPAVDVAAEKFAKDKYGYFLLREGFKAGAAWQKENGNV